MKTFLSFVVLSLSVALFGAKPAHNRLTEKEKADGWELLFDGESMAGWRGYQLDAPSPGWSVEEGSLVLSPAKGMTDLLTKEAYGDFELVVDWQISEGGNSGILFRASEDNVKAWHSAVEVQVLDNEYHKNKKKNEIETVELTHAAGAIYALYPAKMESFRERGALNQDREKVESTIPRIRELTEDVNWKFREQVSCEMKIAVAYLVLGDHDKAIETLEAASEMDGPIFLNRELDLWFIFDRLRGDPRFDALLEG